MSSDKSLKRALYKALQASGIKMKEYGTVMVTLADEDKEEALPLVRRFYELGFNIEATVGTGEFLKEKVEPELAAGKDVLIVGHGAMNSSIVCQVKNMPLKDFWSAGIENCKLMRLI